eukprot:923810-Prorocentrum_minimum.AAC.1
MMDQSDAGSAGCELNIRSSIFVEAASPHDGPIRGRKCGYILMMDQSDAGSAGCELTCERKIRTSIF